MPIFFIIFIWIVYSVIIKNAKSMTGSNSGSRPVNSARPQPPRNQARPVQSRNVPSPRGTSARSRSEVYGHEDALASRSSDNGKTRRLSGTAVLLEDRKNDWLAMQLREEAAVLKRGNGLDLGASHASSCDANLVKEEHSRRHRRARF